MSARSPRGSVSGASNVAEDFEESLKDLQQNNRYEISNLTLIAKESSESAQAISKALENHIRTTAPSRKLPALYVLDSIVKNVGTPYTVYLGRNLYSTFMEAYTLVDTNTRRSMEGMLKTWKEPVPNSLDPRPVFPPETVQPIENALMKAKAAMMGQHRPQQPQFSGMQFQHTPTPPQFHQQFVPPHAQHAFSGYAGHQPTPQPYQPPTPLHYAEVPNPQAATPSVHEVEAIKSDLTHLISRMQGQFASNPQDQALRTKLQALLQLQEVLRLQAQALKPSELQQIRVQIAQLSTTPDATPQWQPPQPQHMVPPPNYGVPPYAQPPVPIPQISTPQQPPPMPFAPGALENLQALLAGGQKPSTPQMRTAVPALQDPSHTQLQSVQKQVNAAPQLSTNDLLAALSKNNLIPPRAVSTPVQSAPLPAVAPPPNMASTDALLASISSFLPQRPQSNATTPQFGIANSGKPRVPMTSAALKTFRPELVRALYDAQPNQCTNCGRRFLADEDGRVKKSRHLDWHFRTNQRMANSSTNRGHHRNWFVDEMEWIRLTEFDPSTTTAEDASQLIAKKKEKNVQDQYVRAPPGMTKNTCSICYEDMKSSYSDELQDWVFPNAVQYAQGKIVHATCAEEIKKSSHLSSTTASTSSLAAAMSSLSGGRSRSATPDSSLGKRKAEHVLAGIGAQRVRIE